MTQEVKQTAVEWLIDNLKGSLSIEQATEIINKAKEMEKDQIESKINKITRFEVINHGNKEFGIGRILTMYQELGDFNSIELSFQDGGRTLKVFLD